MDPQDGLRLETKLIGPLPIINHFIRRLHLDELISRRLTTARSRKVDPATCIGILLRNIIVQRRPVYGIREWALRFRPDLLGITHDQLESINDDRIGAALDALFDTDRASLLTEVVVMAIKEFGLDLSQLHNDATSITLFGDYKEANGDMKRGKKSMKITYGHNKDHRPDLKQLLWFLTVTADGAVPIHYKACDGNTGESPTYRETWDVLRMLVGRPDFIYVTDCKLCSNENLMHIHSNGGRFITVIPRNWSEDAWFRGHIQKNKVDWIEIERSQETANGQNADVWRMVESPMRSSQGFRVVWAWSTRKEDLDRRSRQSLIHRAIIKLEQLETRLRSPKNKLKSKEAVIEAADAALGDIANRWVEYEITEKEESKFRQEKPGRPSPTTNYKRLVKTKFHVEWRPRKENIEFDACSDGMFPLITNCEDLSLKDVLDKYKFQPWLEKRHEQLKTVLAVAPILLKSVTRIEGLLFVYFMALLVQAVIEREVRLAMVKNGLKTVPIYPETRECEMPTTSRMLELFALMELHKLWSDGKLMKVFRTELDDIQKQVLFLAGVSTDAYTLEG
jgi:transposase